MLQGYNVTIWRKEQLVETKIVNTTSLSQNFTPGYFYTVNVSVAVRNGPDGRALKYTFPGELAVLFFPSVWSFCTSSLITL